MSLKNLLLHRKYLIQWILLQIQTEIIFYQNDRTEPTASILKSITILECIKSTMLQFVNDQTPLLIESQAKIWIIYVSSILRSGLLNSQYSDQVRLRLIENSSFEIIIEHAKSVKLYELKPKRDEECLECFADWIIHFCGFFLLNVVQFAKTPDIFENNPVTDNFFDNALVSELPFSCVNLLFLFVKSNHFRIPFLNLLFDDHFLICLQENLIYCALTSQPNLEDIKSFFDLIAQLRLSTRNLTKSACYLAHHSHLLEGIHRDLSNIINANFNVTICKFSQSPQALLNFLDLLPLSLNFFHQTRKPSTIQLLTCDLPPKFIRPQETSRNFRSCYDVISRRALDKEQSFRQCTRCHRVAPNPRSFAGPLATYSEFACPLCRGSWRFYP